MTTHLFIRNGGLMRFPQQGLVRTRYLDIGNSRLVYRHFLYELIYIYGLAHIGYTYTYRSLHL